MNDTLPHYQELEDRLDKEPQKILHRLPDTIESRRAKQLQEQVYSYAKQAREKAPREYVEEE